MRRGNVIDLILSLSKDEAAKPRSPHGSSLDKLAMRRLTMTVSLIAAALVVLSLSAAADELPVSATDRMLVPVRLGSSLLALPEAWIDPGYRAVATGEAIDTLLLTPPIDAFLDGSAAGSDGSAYEAIAILLRSDPDGYWRDLYIGERIARAGTRFGIATPEDAARAFDQIPLPAFHGGIFAASGKSANRALYVVGALETVTYGTVALTARIDDAERVYSISAAIASRGETLAMVITLRTTRLLRPNDLALIDVAVDTVNGRFDLTPE